MQVKKAYRFRLVPTQVQREALDRFAGSCRFVWNWFRAQREAWYQSGVTENAVHERDASLNPNSYAKQCKQLPPLKAMYPWLSEIPSQCLQQTLKDLDRAYSDFFKGQKGYPKYRKREQNDSFRFPDPKGFKLMEGRKEIHLPKMGGIKLRLSRKIQGVLKNATVSRRGKHWYVSLQVETALELPQSPSVPIGIDVGVSDLAAFSDGRREVSIACKRLEKLKQRAQRQLSRKRIGSANWKRGKQRLARIHEHIADKRNDSLHKLSHTISKNHAIIVVEELKIKEMTKSGPSKSKLNAKILNHGWGELFRQLEYKSRWRNGVVVKVNPSYTSQRCHDCGHTESANRQGKRFCCKQCAMEEDADVNAARNILAAGHAATACGGFAVRHPMKQELGSAVKPNLLKVG